MRDDNYAFLLILQGTKLWQKLNGEKRRKEKKLQI
jgi:formiminotetrahydrofolate cyclodeaminase